MKPALIAGIAAALAFVLAIGIWQWRAHHATTQASGIAATDQLVTSVKVSPHLVRNGRKAWLSAHVAPYATCGARLSYPTGPHAQPAHLFTGLVDNSGLVSWMWMMEATGKSGTATVRCSLDGKSSAQSVSFSIVG